MEKISDKIIFIHKLFSILSIEGQTKGVAPEYCCIAALRGLELKNNNPAMWNRLQLLMDHGDENKKSEMEYYEMFKVFVVISLFINCILILLYILYMIYIILYIYS